MSLFACSSQEIKRICEDRSRNLRPEYDPNNPQNEEKVSRARYSRAILKQFATKDITSDYMKQLKNYGRGPGPKVDAKDYIKPGKFSVKPPWISNPEVKAHIITQGKEGNSEFAIIKEKESSLESPFGSDVAGKELNTNDHLAFYWACQWLASLSHRVITDTNRFVKFDKFWSKMEQAMELPSIMSSSHVDTYFLPIPQNSEDLGKWEGNKWVWNDDGLHLKYSPPIREEQKRRNVVVEYYRNGKSIASINRTRKYAEIVPGIAPSAFLTADRAHIVSDGKIPVITYDSVADIAKVMMKNFSTTKPFPVLEPGMSICYRPIKTNPPNFMEYLNHRDTNDCFVVCANKGSGKSTLMEELGDKFLYVDSDVYGQWVNRVLSLNNVFSFNDYLEIPEKKRVKPDLDDYLISNMVRGSGFASHFETLAETFAPYSSNSEPQRRPRGVYRSNFSAWFGKYYENIVKHEELGFGAFSNYMKRKLRVEPENINKIIIFFTHTYIEGSYVKNVINAMKLNPLFDPEGVMKMRSRSTTAKAQLMLYEFYKNYVYADFGIGYPQMFDILKNYSDDGEHESDL